MRKTLLATVAVALLALGGCQAVKDTISTVTTFATVSAPQVVTPQVRQQIHLSYEILLTAAVNYRRLPQCRTSQAATLTAPCSRRSVVIALQGANTKAAGAIHALDEWAISNPTINAASLIAAAKAAIAEWRQIMDANGVSVPAG